MRCDRCPNEAAPERSMCILCLARTNERVKERYRLNREARAANPDAEHPCARCFKQMAVQGRIECLDCWWKATANRYFQSVKFAPGLREIWESQDCRCALTGVSIEPPNMELDHIVALAIGGSNTLDNMQWVLPVINSMKHTLMTDEFVSLCAVILKHSQKC